MEISDDEANMIAGRIFDAIESTGLFNRQLVATEIKAGLALVKTPVKRSGSHEATLARYSREYMTNFFPAPSIDIGSPLDERENYRQQVALARIARERQERAVNPPAFVPSDIERGVVKALEDLIGMPLSPAKRDPDGTAHYRLPDTRKPPHETVPHGWRPQASDPIPTNNPNLRGVPGYYWVGD